MADILETKTPRNGQIDRNGERSSTSTVTWSSFKPLTSQSTGNSSKSSVNNHSLTRFPSSNRLDISGKHPNSTNSVNTNKDRPRSSSRPNPNLSKMTSKHLQTSYNTIEKQRTSVNTTTPSSCTHVSKSSTPLFIPTQNPKFSAFPSSSSSSSTSSSLLSSSSTQNSSLSESSSSLHNPILYDQKTYSSSTNLSVTKPFSSFSESEIIEKLQKELKGLMFFVYFFSFSEWLIFRAKG
jgi:hypothetical protein